jgi:hypothetical protein
MNLIEIWLVGLFGGLHAASWGAYKDSPFEGFKSGQLHAQRGLSWPWR